MDFACRSDQKLSFLCVSSPAHEIHTCSTECRIKDEERNRIHNSDAIRLN